MDWMILFVWLCVPDSEPILHLQYVVRSYCGEPSLSEKANGLPDDSNSNDQPLQQN